MQAFKFLVLLSPLLLFSACGNDDDDDIETGGPLPMEYHITAKVDGADFNASKFDLSTAISNGTYQITGISGDASFTIFIYGEPSVKTYPISETNTNKEAAISWASDHLSSTTNHRVIDGELRISKFENNEVNGSFSGMAQKSTDSTVQVSITGGSLFARFP